MKKIFLFLLLLLPMILLGATGKVLDQGKFYEMRDSTFILWTSRIHSDSTLDTLALINKDGIWIPYGNFSDSLWAKIIRGEYGVLDSLLVDTIKGYLKGEADSALLADSAYWADSSLYADSSGWADQLDGYNEDYFLDTLDDVHDSIYIKYGDSYGSNGLVGNNDTIYIDTLWRSESRVDTFNASYLFGYAYYSNGINFFKSWNFNNLATYCYVDFNSAGDYMIVPLEFIADSIWLDSIAFVYGWTGTPPDADTVYIAFSDSTDWNNGFPRYLWTVVDTVGASEINKDTHGEKIMFHIGKGYRMGNIQNGKHTLHMGAEYEIETDAGEFKWTGIISYWKRFTRR